MFVQGVYLYHNASYQQLLLSLVDSVVLSNDERDREENAIVIIITMMKLDHSTNYSDSDNEDAAVAGVSDPDSESTELYCIA